MWKHIFARKWAMAGAGLALLTLLITEICLTVYIPQWREGFYNVLQSYNYAAFWPQILLFIMLTGGFAICQSMKVWVGQLFSFHIREGITRHFWDKWNASSNRPVGIGQALSESVRSATSYLVEVGCEVLISFAIVVSLVLSNWGNTTLLTAAGIYTVVMMGISWFFYHPTIRRDCDVQYAQGEYRDVLSLEKSKLDALNSTFLSFRKTYYDYIRLVMGFQVCSRLQGVIAALVPYVMLAPLYFSKELTLGAYMSGVATFELIVINTTILISMFPRIVESKASIKILQNVYKSFEK